MTGDEPKRCARDGCTHIAEVTVRRSDTGETRQCCRSCARHLTETTPGLTVGMPSARGLSPVVGVVLLFVISMLLLSIVTTVALL